MLLMCSKYSYINPKFKTVHMPSLRLQAEVARRVPSLQEEVKGGSSHQGLDQSQLKHVIRDRYSSYTIMQYAVLFLQGKAACLFVSPSCCALLSCLSIMLPPRQRGACSDLTSNSQATGPALKESQRGVLCLHSNKQ